VERASGQAKYERKRLVAEGWNITADQLGQIAPTCGRTSAAAARTPPTKRA
jgi:uncharacterized membrane protein YqiK